MLLAHLAALLLAVTPMSVDAAVVAPAAASPSAPEAATAGPPVRRNPAFKWKYDGPQVSNPRWAQVAERFKLCAEGTIQSPIDLRIKEMTPGRKNARPSLHTTRAVFQAKRATGGSALPLLTIDQYFAPPPKVLGDGPLNPPPLAQRAGILNLPGLAKYELVGFHFHGGASEHTFDGRPGVAEVHFVFSRIPGSGVKDEVAAGGKNLEAAAKAAMSKISAITPSGTAEGAGTGQTDATVPDLAVVSVVFKAAEGPGDPFLANLISTVVPASGDTPIEPAGSLVDLDIGSVLPSLENSTFFTYMGSLTTPPCSENVRWVVYQRQLPASAAQVKAILAAQGDIDNVRQTQPFEGLVEKYTPLPYPVDGWDYEGPKKSNPRWAKLADNYKLCGDTEKQSPIDLRYNKMIVGLDALRPHVNAGVSVFQARRAKNGADVPLVSFDQYLVRPPRLVGDAPPVVAWTPPPRGAILTLPGLAEYGLVGFHFHAGSSEHTVGGRSGVAEVHFVFKRIGGPSGITKEAVKAVDEKKSGGESRNINSVTKAAKSQLSTLGRNLRAEVGSVNEPVVEPPPAPVEVVDEDEDDSPIPDVAVLGVIFQEAADGQGDPFLTSLIKTVLPTSGDEYINPVGSLVDVDISKVLAPLEDSEFATYRGSLTTPPCSENVQWIVYKKMLKADLGQVDALVNSQGGTNVRQTQPYNGPVQ
eukprot:contig_12846_g3062